jgi:hypothetical protein
MEMLKENAAECRNYNNIKDLKLSWYVNQMKYFCAVSYV